MIYERPRLLDFGDGQAAAWGGVNCPTGSSAADKCLTLGASAGADCKNLGTGATAKCQTGTVGPA